MGQICSVNQQGAIHKQCQQFLKPSPQYRQFFSTILWQFLPIFDSSPPTNGRRRLWTAPNFDPETVVEKLLQRQTKARKTSFKSWRSEI